MPDDIISPPVLSSFGTNPITALHQSIKADQNFTLSLINSMMEESRKDEELKLRVDLAEADSKRKDAHMKMEQELHGKRLQEADIKLDQLKALRDEEKKKRLIRANRIKTETFRFQTDYLMPIKAMVNEGQYGAALKMWEEASSKYNIQSTDSDAVKTYKMWVMNEISGLPQMMNGVPKGLLKPSVNGSEVFGKDNEKYSKKLVSVLDLQRIAKRNSTEDAKKAAIALFSTAKKSDIESVIGWVQLKDKDTGKFKYYRDTTPEGRRITAAKRLFEQTGMPVRMTLAAQEVRILTAEQQLDEATDMVEGARSISAVTGLDPRSAMSAQLKMTSRKRLAEARAVERTMLKVPLINVKASKNPNAAKAENFRDFKKTFEEELKKEKEIMAESIEGINSLHTAQTALQAEMRRFYKMQGNRLLKKIIKFTPTEDGKPVTKKIAELDGYLASELSDFSAGVAEAPFFDWVDDFVKEQRGQLENYKQKGVHLPAGWNRSDVEEASRVVDYIDTFNRLERLNIAKDFSFEGLGKIVTAMYGSQARTGFKMANQFISRKYTKQQSRKGRRVYKELLTAARGKDLGEMVEIVQRNINPAYNEQLEVDNSKRKLNAIDSLINNYSQLIQNSPYATSGGYIDPSLARNPFLGSMLGTPAAGFSVPTQALSTTPVPPTPTTTK